MLRLERARLIAGLARLVRNIDRAEELAQDALVIALSEWPRTGVSVNPGAWLMTTVKRRAIDAIRRDKMRARKHAEIARELDGGLGGPGFPVERGDDRPAHRTRQEDDRRGRLSFEAPYRAERAARLSSCWR